MKGHRVPGLAMPASNDQKLEAIFFLLGNKEMKEVQDSGADMSAV